MAAYTSALLLIQRRFYGHLSDLHRGQHANSGLQADFNAYGPAVFALQVLQLAGPEHRYRLERQAIQSLILGGGNAYNQCGTALTARRLRDQRGADECWPADPAKAGQHQLVNADARTCHMLECMKLGVMVDGPTPSEELLAIMGQIAPERPPHDDQRPYADRCGRTVWDYRMEVYQARRDKAWARPRVKKAG